jgi:putative ABC transport system substrate-binding protein
MRAASAMPVVFIQVSDPVGGGFVESLARPGGNVTGFTNFESSIGGKWIGLLKEITPGLRRVAILFNPETAPQAGYYLHALETVGLSSAVKTTAAPVRNEAEIEGAIATLARDGGGGLIVMPDNFTTDNRGPIIGLAARYGTPTIYPFRYFAVEGGLMSYGIDPTDLYRRAAPYVDRILKGAKPAELPVQAPTKFELVINLKTAKALGLTVPLIIQMTADEVIE